MQNIQALGGMLAIPQWFIWRLTWNVSDNKYDKVPCYPDGSVYRMNAKDPSNWMPLETALNTLATLTSNDCRYALGFYLTANCGYWFLDLDKCVNADGTLLSHAQTICAAFPGAAWEYSSSRRGLHIFGRGPAPDHSCRDPRFNLEFYTEQRGVAFGLDLAISGNADMDHSGAINWLVAGYFPPDRNPDGSVIKEGQFEIPDPAWRGITDDAALIDKIRSSEKADAGAVFAGVPSNRATFSDLYDRNVDALARRWPNADGQYGESDAEASLIAVLAFWTGRDAPRVERLMRASKLYRPKWDEARGSLNYLRYSIERMFRKHAAGGGAVYGVRPAPVEPVSTLSPVVTVTQAPTDHTAIIDGFLNELNAAGNVQELFAVCDRVKLTPIPHALVERLVYEAKEKFNVFKTPQSSDALRRAMRHVPVRPVGASKGRELTEFGNAMRFIDRYGKGLMYVPIVDNWYRWNEKYWQPAITEEIGNLAYATVMSIKEETYKTEAEEERASLHKFAMDSQRSSMLGNMLKLATLQPEIVAPHATLDANLGLLGVSNGAIDLTTGVLLSSDTSHRITMLAGIEYDPCARSDLFQQTLADCFFGDMEMVSFFKRLMGYTLLGRPKESLLIIPYGSGANGKSTIFGAIQKAMGDYARSVASDTFVAQEGKAGGNAGGPREDLLRLRGARYIYISEIEENSQLRESLIKTLTGDDVIVARGINAKKSIEFKPTFVPIMPTNHRPIIKGDDIGIWRRIMMIPFTRNFVTDKHIVKDIHRGEKLDAELPGVLRWLVEGAIEYRTFGLCTPSKVVYAGDQYREDMDVLKEWLDDRCEIGEGFVELKSTLYRSWRDFADQHGQTRLVPSSNALSRKLVAKNFVADNNKGGLIGRCFVGIRLKNPFRSA